MKKLKRTLSLLLVLAFTVGLLGVGAVPAAAYTDDNSITYQEAVNVMSSLGILEGYPNGSFGPTATVTRAEAVTIIAKTVLGPDAAASLPKGQTPFTDVAADHWANAYITWASSGTNPLIVGYGDGTFGPGDNVTNVQFAKMLLVALGYGKNAEFADAAWEVNTVTLAMGEGIFDGMADLAALSAVDFGLDSTREQSCLYSFNAMFVPQVSWNSSTQKYDDVVENLESLMPGAENLVDALTDVGLLSADASALDAAELQALGKYQVYSTFALKNFGYNGLVTWLPINARGLALIPAGLKWSDVQDMLDATYRGSSRYSISSSIENRINTIIDTFGTTTSGLPMHTWIYDLTKISSTKTGVTLTYTEEVEGGDIYADLLDAGLTANQISAAKKNFETYVDGISGEGYLSGDIAANKTGTGESDNGVLTEVTYYVDSYEVAKLIISSTNTYLGEVVSVSKTNGTIDVEAYEPGSGDFTAGYDLDPHGTWRTFDGSDYKATGFAKGDVVTFTYSWMEKADSSKIYGMQSVELAETEVGELGNYSGTASTATHVYIDGSKFLYNPMWIYNATQYISSGGTKGNTITAYLDRYDNVLGIKETFISSNYALVLGKEYDDDDVTAGLSDDDTKRVTIYKLSGDDSGSDTVEVNMTAAQYTALLAYEDYVSAATLPDIVTYKETKNNSDVYNLTVLTAPNVEKGDGSGSAGVRVSFETDDSAITIGGSDFKVNADTVFVTPRSSNRWNVYVGNDDMVEYKENGQAYVVFQHDTSTKWNIVWLFDAANA